MYFYNHFTVLNFFSLKNFKSHDIKGIIKWSNETGSHDIKGISSPIKMWRKYEIITYFFAFNLVSKTCCKFENISLDTFLIKLELLYDFMYKSMSYVEN